MSSAGVDDGYAQDQDRSDLRHVNLHGTMSISAPTVQPPEPRAGRAGAATSAYA